VEEALRAQKHKTEPSMIKESIKFDENGSRGFIYFLQPDFKYGNGLKSEAYLWKRTGFILTSNVSIDRVEVAASRIKALAQNLRYRGPGEIPEGPGFCIHNGFIPDDGEKHESADAGFTFSDRPDVFINLSTITKTPGPTLLERQGGALGMLGALVSKVRKLREGERVLSGLAGQESQIKAPNESGHMAHLFVWETQGQDRSNHPFIEIELQTGHAGKNGNDLPSSLTDKQAIALWDQILASLRLRPTTPDKTSEAAPAPDTPPRLPLGTKVSSLRSCPETGVYECPPGAPGVAERRMYIKQYQPMPGAFVMQPKRGIAGFFGGQESNEVETTWTLVAYEQKA
jgi:hypothetical protein